MITKNVNILTTVENLRAGDNWTESGMIYVIVGIMPSKEMHYTTMRYVATKDNVFQYAATRDELSHTRFVANRPE